MTDDANRPLLSALLIKPPPQVAAFVERLRAQRDTVAEWLAPPHITIMYPFVSPGTVAGGPDPVIVAETRHALAAVCAAIQPFAVTLDRFETFNAGGDEFPGGALYLALQDPAPVVALYRRVLAAFPAYPAYSGEFGDELLPHMTVMTFQSEAEREAFPRPAFAPLTFRVEALHFLYGEEETLEHWTTAAVVPLGGGS